MYSLQTHKVSLKQFIQGTDISEVSFLGVSTLDINTLVNVYLNGDADVRCFRDAGVINFDLRGGFSMGNVIINNESGKGTLIDTEYAFNNNDASSLPYEMQDFSRENISTVSLDTRHSLSELASTSLFNEIQDFEAKSETEYEDSMDYRLDMLNNALVRHPFSNEMLEHAGLSNDFRSYVARQDNNAQGDLTLHQNLYPLAQETDISTYFLKQVFEKEHKNETY